MEGEFNIEFMHVTITVLPAQDSNYIVTFKEVFREVEIPALIGILYPLKYVGSKVKWTSDDDVQPELIEILGDIIEDMCM